MCFEHTHTIFIKEKQLTLVGQWKTEIALSASQSCQLLIHETSCRWKQHIMLTNQQFSPANSTTIPLYFNSSLSETISQNICYFTQLSSLFSDDLDTDSDTYFQTWKNTKYELCNKQAHPLLRTSWSPSSFQCLLIYNCHNVLPKKDMMYTWYTLGVRHDILWPSSLSLIVIVYKS